MIPVLQPATPEMAPAASSLIYLTMGNMADYLFGSDYAQKYLMHLFQKESNRFSYQFTKVATSSSEVVGLVVAYSGRLMKSLELPTALNLVQELGILRFLKFIKRALPLVGMKEAENDAYFISNIAVFPTYQGQGIGKLLLSHSEDTARAQGFKKMSLNVDVKNARAYGLYKKIGYKVMYTVNIKSLQKRIGYKGSRRMVKVLI